MGGEENMRFYKSKIFFCRGGAWSTSPEKPERRKKRPISGYQQI